MRHKYLKFKNWLLITIGSALGLQVACVGPETDSDESDPRDPEEELYACPEVDYEVKDCVTL